ncbi:MAG: hypothetical protein J6S96_02885 [Muribaculaceae bacterium]|nr:hypothetical protein [Muribaculaceae bacterium]
MDSAVSKILSQVYELEGLLLVVDKHGQETPDLVYDMIRNHAADIHEMVQLLEKPQNPEQVTPVDTPEPAELPDEPDAFEVTESILPETEEPLAEPDEDMPPRSAEDEPKEVFTFDIPAESEPVAAAAPTMRVDEKLQRSMSKDLRRAFSVNDRFRFRRELFGNNEADFVDALNMIEAMHSYDEATEYFLGDLGWDEDVPEVTEFLNIVRHHFDA